MFKTGYLLLMAIMMSIMSPIDKADVASLEFCETVSAAAPKTESIDKEMMLGNAAEKNIISGTDTVVVNMVSGIDTIVVNVVSEINTVVVNVVSDINTIVMNMVSDINTVVANMVSEMDVARNIISGIDAMSENTVPGIGIAFRNILETDIVVRNIIPGVDTVVRNTVSGSDPVADPAPGDSVDGLETGSGNGNVAGGSGIGTAPVIDPLRIDAASLYPEMDHTYEQGYIPKIENEKAYIILPLIGQTYDRKVTVTADLGSTQDSPFVFGNYSQTADDWDGVYVFRFEIPLAANRINGTYLVMLTASYLNAAGNQTQQSFPVYVTITDGSDPSDQNANLSGSGKEAVEKPRLFISTCEISPGIVGGEEEFTVTVSIENIGAIRARSVLLSYGSDTEGIIPKQTNNLMHLENIASGHSETASFEFKTTKEVPAGNQSFFIKLDYEDLYGGIYTETRNFLVSVTQPAEMEYDPIIVPEQVTSGETFTIPVNVFNTGKSTLQNVFITISVPGLFPTSSSFFGDILPGESENGEMKIYVGTLSLAGVSSEDYGKTYGVLTISYFDDSGEEHKAETNILTEILPPAAEDTDSQEEDRTVGQWWISVLAAFAIIAIMVASIVVTRFTRLMRMKQ